MLINSIKPIHFSAKTERTENPQPIAASLKADTVSFSANPVYKLSQVRKFMQKPLEQGFTIPALNINNLEGAQAVIAAAIAKKSPVIVQVSAGARKYAGGEGNLVAMFKSLKNDLKEAKIPAILHLDHGEDFKVCKACIDGGFDSVMIDASKHSFEENARITKEVVDYAHARGVFVEAELGRIAGSEDLIKVSDKEAFFTDPKEAAEFVRLTGCDSLAVSVGTKHGPVKFQEGEEPKLDFPRLMAIKNEIEKILPENQGKEPYNPTWKQYPLVLHGASSAPQDLVARANEFFVIPRALGEKIMGLLTGKKGNKKEIAAELDKHAKEIAGKGIPESIYAQARGLVAKLNVDTDLRMGVTATVKKAMAENPTNIDPRGYLKPARTVQQEIAERKMDVLGSSDKA